jgi:two-component system, NarL family, response regulator LiaR
MREPIRVLIVDDHAIVREGLVAVLAEEPTVVVVGEASSGAEAVEKAPVLKPDVILMDLMMPGIDGIEATRRVRAVYPTCQILVLTSFAEEGKVREAIQAGAIGYLLKDVLKPELLSAVYAAAAGKPTLHPEAQRQLMQQITTPAPPSPFAELTERETDVLRLIASGQSNKEIAASLKLTEGTVKGYVSAILVKLDVADRTQAALFAVKHGLDTGEKS